MHIIMFSKYMEYRLIKTRLSGILHIIQNFENKLVAYTDIIIIHIFNQS